MKYTIRVKAILAVCLLLAASVIAFALTSTLLKNNTVLADDGASIVSVANTEEASQAAGYQVAAPTYLPPVFEKAPNITVHETNSNNPKRVMLIWKTGEKGTFLLLVNDPSLDGIGGGEKTIVCGVQGEREFSEATNDRPALLSLYWRDGDMSYVLTGTVNESLNEDTLEKIASSVAAK
jgi:hypothetical protein